MRMAVLLVVVLALGGCFGSDGGDGNTTTDGPTGTSTGTTMPPPSCTEQAGPVAPGRTGDFDGAAALAWVDAIVYEAPEVLRPRIPVDDEATCTAAWLGRALDAPGWDVHFSNFTAAEYRDLPKGDASSYADDCPASDEDELDGTAFHNIYATREGGDRTILLAAHWDQKEDAEGGGTVPGANDGASGMGVLLEMQRSMEASGLTLPFDVVVAFFDGEDGFYDCHPLAGSIHFAQTMPVQVDRMILLDMVGDAAARFPREIFSRDADEALQDLIWEKAADLGLEENFVDTQRKVLDDHRPFIDAGVPAVDIIDYARPSGEGRFGFPPYWHTVDDTPDKLDADMLGAMGDLILEVLQDPRFVETWPEHAGA